MGVPYSADELMAAYLADADAYKADWVNHRINVTGTVKEVSRAGEVYLSTSYEGEEVILAGLTDALTNDVIEGDSVTFACVIGDYYRGAIDMTDCRPAEHGNEQGRDGASDLGAPYSADELMAAYLDDADAYDSDWVNHRINVAGTVKEIIRAEIYLSTSFGDDVVVLSGLADETLDGIAAGDIVEFACVIGGYSRGGIDMTDCGPAGHGNEQGRDGASDLGAPYSADELMAAYLDDADAYESDWVNHRINVAGTVKEIIRAEVYLSTSFGDDVVVLSGLADETLDEIAAGDTVEFACVIGGYERGGIGMTDCGPAEHGNEQGNDGARE